jgi:hypothetical protein
MKEKEKEMIALINKESQATLDEIKKLIAEDPGIPEDIKEKAFVELEKTKNKIEKTIAKG